MTAFLQDLRYAARGLRRAPGFTLVAGVTNGNDIAGMRGSSLHGCR